MAGYVKNSDGGYSVNYDDERFQDVKNEQAQQEAQTNQIYDNILSNSDQYYQNQINATQNYEKTQTELQQAQTDYAIGLVEQQKEQAQKDYTKEQKGAYVDYMKQTKSNAQNMANSGLSNTGYSESSIVGMYNEYQNRVGTAKESLNNTIMNYNNNIQQAILSNNEKLAEIAYNSLQTQNQLNQQAFEYKNSVLLEKENALQNINDRYYARYQDVLSEINTEIELQMELDRIDREYEQWLEEFKQRQAQYDEQNRQWWANYNSQISQWEKEYALKSQETAAQVNYYNAQANKLKEETSNTSSNSNPYSTSNSKSTSNSNQDDEKEKILSNIKIEASPGAGGKNIVDGLTGKKYASVDELLKAYGYAAI